MRSTMIYLVLSAAVVAVTGCARGPKVPCPTDQQLIDALKLHEAAVAAIAADPTAAAIPEGLQIERMIPRSTDPKQVWFQVWFKDFAGPGGCMKGYAYCEEEPVHLVDSIDANSDPGSPESKEIYRHVTGSWYLFYSSDN